MSKRSIRKIRHRWPTWKPEEISFNLFFSDALKAKEGNLRIRFEQAKEIKINSVTLTFPAPIQEFEIHTPTNAEIPILLDLNKKQFATKERGYCTDVNA